MFETLATKLFNRKLSVFIIAVLAVSMTLGVRAGNFALIVFLGYCLLAGWRSLLSPAVSQWRLLLPVALYLAYLVGFFWTENYTNASKELERKIFLLACPVGVFLIYSQLTKQDIVKVFHVFVFVCLALSVVCYANAIANIIRTGSLTVVELTERQYYYFTYLHLTKPVKIDPIYMSLFCNFCIMALLAEGFKNKLIDILLVIYFAIFNVFVNAKIGLVVLVVIIVLYLFFSLKSRSVALLVGVLLSGLILTVVLNSTFLADRFKVGLDFDFSDGYAGNWNSVSQRIAIWTCASDAAKTTFPWGNGTGDGQEVLVESYRKFNYYRGHQDNINAHSEYFQTQLDLGLAGNIILIAILLLPLFESVKQKHYLMMAFSLVMILYLFVEVVFARRYGVMFFSLFYALLNIHALKKDKVQ